MIRRLAPIAAVALVLLGTPQPVPAQSRPSASASDSLAALRKQEERLIRLGERLATAAADAGWCEPAQSLGWTLGELGQYPKSLRQHVRRAWALPDGPALFVSALAPDGAAARAGLQPGTGIVSIDGNSPMRNVMAEASRHALANNERVIDAALARGPLRIETVSRDGTRAAYDLIGRAACPSRFELSAEDEEQAYADGSVVQVTAGMGRYTNDSDDELAGVIAHELAHNMLRHIPRSEEAGTPTDYTRHLGRYARISRKMEEEADRLSVWLLAAAGMNPEAPVTFWRRFGPNHDSAHPFGRLHDPWRTRVAAIEDELAKMRAAKASDGDARPSLLDLATITIVPSSQIIHESASPSRSAPPTPPQPRRPQ
jgi:beta-barrel assembly-enhancing protease